MGTGSVFKFCITLFSNYPFRQQLTLNTIRCLETLRALYLGDNDFERLPAEVGQLKNLQIVRFISLATIFSVTGHH